MTAGPMQLRMLLYDGALKHCRQARTAIENDDFEQSYNSLSRVQNIVLELSNSLNHQQTPELCERLAALYNYLYRQLVNANLNRDVSILDEVIHLLDYERETWRQLMEKMGETSNSAPAAGDQSAASSPYAAPSAAGANTGQTSTLSRSA
jgi:flagellar protein FliS